jgi:hypothetical protein
LKKIFLTALSMFVFVSALAEVSPSSARLEQLVEANIVGVHAYQMMLAHKQSKMDAACWSSTATDTELQDLVAHQASLLNSPQAARSWAFGSRTKFDPGKDLQPLLAAKLLMPANLPVNVFTAYLHKNAPTYREEEVRSVANLYQTVLEVERDGDRLQDLYSFYIALGLPVYVGQLGLPGTDTDFLASGRLRENKSCVSPLDQSAAAWQIAGRKIWNWGEKNLHVRDARVVADELLDEPDVKALEPKMKALPGQRIAIIGHSYTMDLHWASPSAFVPIVTAMFSAENPKVEFRQFQAGGLTAARAFKSFYQEALAWHPDTVLFVVATRTDEDLASLRTMGLGFKAAGTRVITFDDVHDPEAPNLEARKRETETAQQAGIEVVPISAILSAAPDRASFSCLDHIHMTEPYHRLMAKQWLKLIVEEPLNPR